MMKAISSRSRAENVKGRAAGLGPCFRSTATEGSLAFVFKHTLQRSVYESEPRPRGRGKAAPSGYVITQLPRGQLAGLFRQPFEVFDQRPEVGCKGYDTVQKQFGLNSPDQKNKAELAVRKESSTDRPHHSPRGPSLAVAMAYRRLKSRDASRRYSRSRLRCILR